MTQKSGTHIFKINTINTICEENYKSSSFFQVRLYTWAQRAG